MSNTDLIRERQADIRLTKGFFLGVFPLTRAQYVGLGYTTATASAIPVRCLNYEQIRGDDSAAGWCFPTNRTVDANSIIGRLRTRTSLDFDLPTDEQWEYACRAGSTGEYFFVESGDLVNQIKEYAVFDRETAVGTKKPNAWGLYDLVGCCHQWTTTLACTDDSGDSSKFCQHADGTDPVGGIPTYDHPYRYCRGSHWNASGAAKRVCRASYRLQLRTNISTGAGSEGYNAGCRIALPLDIQ